MKDDRLYLVHITDRLGRIANYTEGGRDAFMRSPVVQDAVMRNLEVVGEAAKRVPEAVRAVHQGNPPVRQGPSVYPPISGLSASS